MRQNKPVDSQRAKAKIAIENKSFLREGFLLIPKIKLPKTDPIPTPAPIIPIVAKPAPIILDSININELKNRTL